MVAFALAQICVFTALQKDSRPMYRSSWNLAR